MSKRILPRLSQQFHFSGFTLIRTLLRKNLAADAGRTLLRKNLVSAQRGFTLIELLVVVMTMALLFGLGMARYRDFSRRKAVEGVRTQIRNDLLLIQEYVLSGKKPDPSDDPNDWCKSPNFLNAYRFRTAGSNTYTYRIQAVCSGGTVDDKQVNLKNPGPRIQDVRRISNCLNPETAGGSNIGGNWFEFVTLAKGVNILNGMPVGDCLRIRITQGSTTYSIIIDSSGSIR